MVWYVVLLNVCCGVACCIVLFGASCAVVLYCLVRGVVHYIVRAVPGNVYCDVRYNRLRLSVKSGNEQHYIH